MQTYSLQFFQSFRGLCYIKLILKHIWKKSIAERLKPFLLFKIFTWSLSIYNLPEGKLKQTFNVFRLS